MKIRHLIIMALALFVLVTSRPAAAWACCDLAASAASAALISSTILWASARPSPPSWCGLRHEPCSSAATCGANTKPGLSRPG